MKGKDEDRLRSLYAMYERGEQMTCSERRQFRKLLARDEKLGREWRLVGMQTRRHGKKRALPSKRPVRMRL